MAETKLDIIIRMKDEMTAGIKRAGASVEDFGRSVERSARQLNGISTRMAFLGAGLSAPFVLALKSVEKFSYGVESELKRTENIWNQYNATIANAALPTFKEFNDILSKMVNVMNSINPKLLEQIAHWTLVTAGVLIGAAAFLKAYAAIQWLVGSFMVLGGTMITFSGAVIPGLIAVIGGLIFAWLKFHDQFVLVVDSLKFLWLQFCDTLAAAWQSVMRTISKIPGTSGFAKQVDDLTIARQKLKQEMDAIAAGGNSNWSQGLNNFSAQIQSTYKNLQGAFSGVSTQMGTLMVDMGTRAHDLAMSFADGFGDAFDKIIFEGQSFGDSMKNLFQNIGRDLVKDFVKTGFKNILNKMFFPEQQAEGGQGIGGGFANMLLGIFNPMKQASNTTANSMSNASQSTNLLAQSIGGGTNALGGFFSSLTSFGSGIMGLTGSLFQGLSGILGSLGGGLGSLIGGIGGGLGGMFSGILGGLGTALMFFHNGGVVKPLFAHTGLAPDEVPIVAQTGEGVLSRRGMQALGGSDRLRKLNSGQGGGGGGVTVMVTQVIQAWDAQDVYRNRRTLSAALANEIRTNGNLRKVIKES